MSRGKRVRPAGVAWIAGLQALAVVVLVAAWSGASQEVRLSDQWAWGALATGALTISAIGHSLVLITFRRRIARAAGRFAGRE